MDFGRASRANTIALFGTPRSLLWGRNSRSTSRSRERAADLYEVDVERTCAMLVLTAIHDIMKVEALLPKVSAEHAPYGQYASGDVIHDHDAALGYILETCGERTLPSFGSVPSAQQRVICFTQSKIGFNHGWLVQAEAPPSALFSTFKSVINSEGVAASDIAFYFVHWLTDLAGAEPAPLRGSEKFVLHFPQPVFGSFIASFSFINELAYRSETEVVEAYLIERWSERKPQLGPVPTGESAIALMRLVVQAQNLKEQIAVVAAFHELGEDDRHVLTTEMAMTGILGQTYTTFPDAASIVGPAFLVYYSPAFVRTVAKHEPLTALQVHAHAHVHMYVRVHAHPCAHPDRRVHVRVCGMPMRCIRPSPRSIAPHARSGRRTTRRRYRRPKGRRARQVPLGRPSSTRASTAASAGTSHWLTRAHTRR